MKSQENQRQNLGIKWNRPLYVVGKTGVVTKLMYRFNTQFSIEKLKGIGNIGSFKCKDTFLFETTTFLEIQIKTTK